MCDPVTLTVTAMAATTAAGGISAYGQIQQGKSQSKMYRYQASLAQQQADITRKYAEEQKKSVQQAAEAQITGIQTQAAEESKNLSREISQLTGSQRAAIGYLGIGGATAEDILNDTFTRSRADQAAIRYNANVKSWGVNEQARREIWSIGEQAKFNAFALESEAAQYGAAAKNAKRSANIGAFSTILETAGAVTLMGMSGLKGSTKAKSKPQLVTV